MMRYGNLDLQRWTEPSEEVLDEFKNRLGPSLDSFIGSLETILQQLGKLIEDNERSYSFPPLTPSKIVRYCSLAN